MAFKRSALAQQLTETLTQIFKTYVSSPADCGNTGQTNQSNVGEVSTIQELETATSATTDCMSNPLQQMDDNLDRMNE